MDGGQRRPRPGPDRDPIQLVLHLRGYGDAGNGRPVTPDTQFLVAFTSKSFTALAVLQLVEAGRVQLDAPVAIYLPGFAVADPAGARRITVRRSPTRPRDG